MVSTADKSMQTILDEICAKAVDKAVENGAVRETVKIAEMDSIPLQVRLFCLALVTNRGEEAHADCGFVLSSPMQYVANKSRVIVKGLFSILILAATENTCQTDEIHHII